MPPGTGLPVVHLASALLSRTKWRFRFTSLAFPTLPGALSAQDAPSALLLMPGPVGTDGRPIEGSVGCEELMKGRLGLLQGSSMRHGSVSRPY